MSDTSADPAALVLGSNKSYGFYPQWVPDSDHWNSMFSRKVDDDGGILANPSVVGNITLDKAPTDPSHGVPKSYVDALLGGPGGGMPDAPSDGTPYCRLNGAWSPAPTTLTPNVTGDLTVTGGLAVWEDATFNGSLTAAAWLNAADLYVINTASVGDAAADAYVWMAPASSADSPGWSGIAIGSRSTGDLGTYIEFDLDSLPRFSIEVTDNLRVWTFDDAGAMATNPALMITRKGNILLGMAEPANVLANANGGWAFANGITTSAALFNLYTDNTNFFSLKGGYGWSVRNLGFQLNFEAAPNVAAGAGVTPAIAMYIDQNLSLLVNGQAYKPGGGSWNSVSDERLKTNIADYKAGLAEISQLRPVSYQYNGQGGMPATGQTYYGLIAQAVAPVMPEMIATRTAKLNPDDAAETELLTLDATPLLYALANAVTELAARVMALETA
jgi:hypothetical protein